MKKNILLLFSLVILFSSCSKKIAFTSDIQSRYNFSENTLKQVQFYTSNKIILYKTLDVKSANVNDGKLLIINKNESERIIIKKNSPCVLEKIIISPNLFLFSFEYGDGKVIAFGNNSGEGYYSLMAKNWDGKKAILTYANKNYYTYNGDVFLTVKMKKLSKVQNRERTVKGIKIKK